MEDAIEIFKILLTRVQVSKSMQCVKYWSR